MTVASQCSCVICKKLTSNLGIAAHCKRSHPTIVDEIHNEKLRQKSIESRRGKPSWNSGKTKSEFPQLAKSEEEKTHLRHISTGKAKTPELEELRKAKIKKTTKLTNGGYRRGSGRGKKRLV